LVSDLLMRCGHHDQGALAMLYDLLSPIVTAAVSMSVSQTRVGDGVRDVFVELWRDAPGYRSGDVSSIEWIMDRVATVSARLDGPDRSDSSDSSDRHGTLADAG